MDSAELDLRFDHHPPTDDRVAHVHAAIRFDCKSLAAFIVAQTKPGREQSLAITALEEAMMWANAAIARNGLPE